MSHDILSMAGAIRRRRCLTGYGCLSGQAPGPPLPRGVEKIRNACSLVRVSAHLSVFQEEVQLYRTILVPLDGSQRAEVVLRHVEDLALRFQARVVFLQIVEPAALVMAPEAAYMNLRRNDFEQRIAKAEAYLAVQQGKFRQIGIEAETRIAVGPAVEAIAKAAERENADLIVLASHGRSGLSQVFYGSVAAGVLQRVSRPLLLVRSQKGR
jgi:nucleotide-binding universal stress UspA family protein